MTTNNNTFEILCFKMFSGHTIISQAQKIFNDNTFLGYNVKQIRTLGMMPHPGFPPNSGMMMIRFIPYFIGAKDMNEANNILLPLKEEQYHTTYIPEDNLLMAYMEEVATIPQHFVFNQQQH